VNSRLFALEAADSQVQQEGKHSRNFLVQRKGCTGVYSRTVSKTTVAGLNLGNRHLHGHVAASFLAFFRCDVQFLQVI